MKCVLLSIFRNAYNVSFIKPLSLNPDCLLHVDADKWIADYSRVSQTNWNVRKTKVGALMRKDYVCHLGGFRTNSKKGKKSINRYKDHSCPAKIIIKVLDVDQEYSSISFQLNFLKLSLTL